MSLRWRVTSAIILGVVAVVLGVTTATTLFLRDGRTVVVAGHDSVVRPTLNGEVVFRTGPILPDFRRPDSGLIGVNVELGKTEVGSLEELAQRYAVIASHPESQVAKIRQSIKDMAVSAALRGAGVGLVPVAIWLLLGPHRRGELFRGVRTPGGAVAGAFLLCVPLLLWQPWETDEPTQDSEAKWVSLQDFLGSAVTLPAEAKTIEVRTGPTTTGSRRLIESALSTYEQSKKFYSDAAKAASELDLPQPEEDQTVALLVSDRHDNIGMDSVAKAIADRAGATVILDAGDDTSSGQPWESFSLDSLSRTFEDFDRFAIAGNHDHGSFVIKNLASQGWTTFDGTPVEGPGGGQILGVDDPRSSGLGNWRDEKGLSFTEVGIKLADAACESDKRINTLLVHDANLGRETLRRGCADLVVGGHTHVQAGPTQVVSQENEENGDGAGAGSRDSSEPRGHVGYSWTNGTTGGAAYAIAAGSKPRRDAEVSLITYDENGRPIQLQWVRLQTNGNFVVGEPTTISPGNPDNPDNPDGQGNPDSQDGPRTSESKTREK